MAFTSWMICPKGFPSPLISIHAPRTGSDPTPAMSSWKAAYFNPRSPHGERHTSSVRPRGRQDFNPRSPHGERPTAANTGGLTTSISIHAPRTGSDHDQANLAQI